MTSRNMLPIAGLILAGVTGCEGITFVDAGPLTDAGQGTDSARLDGGTSTSDAGAPVSATELALQDISILYPFPTGAELGTLLTAASSGAHGELVPEEVFAMLPPVVSHPNRRSNARTETRLVGLRANCAFDTLLRDDPCHGQLQLVFQVIATGAGGSAEIFDASIHAIYPLDDATFMQLLRDLLALRNANGGFAAQPLGVHPIMAREGLAGAFASATNDLVLRYGGADNLHKVTFITIDEPTPDARGGEVWTFGAVEHSDAGWESLEIPTFTTATTEQTLSSIGPATSAAASDFAVRASPALPATADLGGLFGSGAIADAAAAESAYELALRLENPELRSVADAECISCHVSHARQRGELLLGLSPAGRASYYAAAAGVEGASMRSAVGVRAMGWSVFAPRPSDALAGEGASRAISQRVVNETVYTLNLMNPQL